MSRATLAPASIAPAAAAPPAPAGSRATMAHAFFLAFVILVYSHAAVLWPWLAPIVPAQSAMILALLGLAWATLLGRRPFRLGFGGGGLALYLFFLPVLLSPAWSLWPRLSVTAAAESAKYLAAFLLAVNLLDTRRRVRQALAVLTLASLFPAIGAIQSKITGAHIVEGTRAAWIGPFGNPNFLAFHLVLVVPLALGLRDTAPPGATRALRRTLWLAVTAVLATAIFLTESRGGTLGLLSVLLLWLARGLVHGRVALGGALALAIAVLATPGGPWDRAATQATLAGEVDASAQGRIDACRAALRMIEARPAVGVGGGAFLRGYERYAPSDAGPPRTAHNSFLMVAAELGLPALILYVAALVGAFRGLGRAARRHQPRSRPEQAVLERSVQTALLGFVVASMFGGFAFVWPLFFLLGAAAAVVRAEERARVPA